MTEQVASPFAASASQAFGIEDLTAMTPGQRFHAYRERVGDEEVMARLCDAIVGGASLHSWVNADGFSYTVARRWIMNDPQRRADYEQARMERADYQAEQVAEVAAEDCTEPVFDSEGREVGRKVSAAKVQQAKLKADSLKWIAGRMNNRYADKVQVDANIGVQTISDGDLVTRLGALGGPAIAALAQQVLSTGQLGGADEDSNG